MIVRLWCALFVCSGAAAILYQVVFNKIVSYVFGSTAYATSTVLAAYMAGLSAGSFLGGRLADRVKRPLLWYGVAEIGAGLWFYQAWRLLALSAPLEARLATGGSLALVTAYQFVASLLVIMLPTVLLGATFPLVVRGLFGRTEPRRLTSLLYFSNTLGTAIGTVVASYLLIPRLGLTGTLRVGLLLALGLSLAAVSLARRAPPAPALPEAVAAAPPRPGGMSRRMVLGFCFASGLSVFAWEVVWTHLYALLLGNSVYSFATVLFCVLFGMALGSVVVARSVADPIDLLIIAEIALVGVSLVLIQSIDFIPAVFDAAGSRSLGFHGRELVKFAVTAVTLLPSCVCLGIVFPTLLALVPASAAGAGRAIGAAYAINTLGAVIGSVVTGFFLLPHLGSRGTSYLVIAANAGLAALLLTRAGGRALRARPLLAATTGLAMVVVVLHPSWSWRRLLQATGVYFTPMPTSTFKRILDNREDVHGGVTTVVESPEGVRFLLSNGKFQGDSGPEIVDQYGQALLTELYPHGHEAALNIGVGTGGTLGVLSLLSYERVVGVELAAPILDMARAHFADINFGALDKDKPGVTVLVRDGRHYLATLPQEARFDTITVQVSSLWFAGAANLYSRDLYALAAARLREGGVFQQWVQLHHTRREDLAVILRTLRAEFPYLALFVPGHQGIVIASREPLTLRAAHLASLRMPPPLAARGLDFEDLAGSLLLGPAEVDAFLAAAPPGPLSTDDFPILEFETPKGNALGFNFSEIVTDLMAHRRGGAAAHFVAAGLPPDEAQRMLIKLKLREMKLYRPYTLAWLAILNDISMLDLTEGNRAFFQRQLEAWRGP
ncbi:fused MFS/spermidine synthase [Sorangium sp. So ce1182]|uniref:fused MFS/spermidine synthase n=1 Tax=Sorangium sp. So ce1182 TaxID=3133334 RepID=UPI003F62F228